MSPKPYRSLSFAVTRYHFVFDNFDNIQCDDDMFSRNTDIWKLDDVCPAPKTYLPEKSYDDQSQASLRGKRQCTDSGDECTTSGIPSIDVSYCKDADVYNPENILVMQNRLCCLQPNFRVNAITQITRSGGTKKDGRNNFKATRDKCCEQYKDQVQGVDALKTLGCPFAN